MDESIPTTERMALATLCANHTRRIQLLAGTFWKGDIDMWHYRKHSRELTQQFVDELSVLLNRIGHSEKNIG